MGVAVQIEIGKIHEGFRRAACDDLTGPDEPAEALCDFDVHQVWRMKLLPVSKEAGLDAGTERGLQEKFQHRRRVNDNHADSRSSRMTAAAGVFSVTRRRL